VEADDVHARLVNRLGALVHRVEDEISAATERFRGAAASHPEALSALANFADGERAESLQDALGLSQPGVAHLVAKLEREGLVERRPDPDDARAARIHLTPRGRLLARAMVAARQRAVAELLAPLDAGERASMLAVVDRVLEGATTSTATARRTCRSCDPDACDHPATCPVTASAERYRRGGR
jgi:DNA-binding MarR family transcriptional regulator